MVRANVPFDVSQDTEFRLLPVTGEGSPEIRFQGRWVFPESVSDLVSSIAADGVLQPILVETGDDGSLWVVAGERRLTAARRVLNELPDVRTLDRGIPAVVFPGPLSLLERRRLQVTENFVREDLTPTEMGRALMMTRCALLAERLEAAGSPPPPDLFPGDEPAVEFRALDKFRVEQGHHHLGASLRDVLDVLRLEISESRAQDLVRAYATIPADIAEDMDAADVAVRSRLMWVALLNKDRELAEDLWDEVTEQDRVDLIGPAAMAATNGAGDAAAAVAEADTATGGDAAGPVGGSDPQVKVAGLVRELDRMIRRVRNGQQLDEQTTVLLRERLTDLLSCL